MALLEPIQEKSAPPTEAQAQIVRGCADCKVNYSDPSPADMVLYLHALRYLVAASKTSYNITKNSTIPTT